MAHRRQIWSRPSGARGESPPCSAKGCGKPSTAVMVLEKSDAYEVEWRDVRSTWLCAEHEAAARRKYYIGD